MGDILKFLLNLYPAVKLFNIYMSYLKADNVQKYSKLVCLLELKSLIDVYGVGVSDFTY